MSVGTLRAKVAKANGLSIAANQIMFNLLDYNSPQIQLVKKACDELGITIIAYSPIGQGV